MDWVLIWSAVVAIATAIYTVFLLLALLFARTQTNLLVRNRELEIVLTIFRELKTKDFMAKRRYIYDNIPENVDGISDDQLKKYLIRMETALTAFERVGYLLREKHVNKKPIMDLYWASVWRCWRKCRSIILWARKKREQRDYFRNFQFLAKLAEQHRREQGYAKPKFYPAGKVITK